MATCLQRDKKSDYYFFEVHKTYKCPGNITAGTITLLNIPCSVKHEVGTTYILFINPYNLNEKSYSNPEEILTFDPCLSRIFSNAAYEELEYYLYHDSIISYEKYQAMYSEDQLELIKDQLNNSLKINHFVLADLQDTNHGKQDIESFIVKNKENNNTISLTVILVVICVLLLILSVILIMKLKTKQNRTCL